MVWGPDIYCKTKDMPLVKFVHNKVQKEQQQEKRRSVFSKCMCVCVCVCVICVTVTSWGNFIFKYVTSCQCLCDLNLRCTVECAGSRVWLQRRQCWILRRALSSVTTPSPSARSCCPRHQVVRSPCPRVSSGCWPLATSPQTHRSRPSPRSVQGQSHCRGVVCFILAQVQPWLEFPVLWVFVNSCENLEGKS